MSPAAEAPTPSAWEDIDWSVYIHRVLIDGRFVQYLDYGEGPVVVLVHGLGGAWQNWLENLVELGSECRVIAVDLPGFGGSDPLPPPAPMTEHAEVLEWLLDRLGVENVILVGHSLGGVVTMIFAESHPERLDGLVLVCGGGIAFNWWRLQAIVSGFTVFNAVFSIPGVVRAISLRPRLRRTLIGGALADPSSLSAALAAQVIPPMAAAPGFLGAISAGATAVGDLSPETIDLPALLIWGTSDPILPVDRARTLASVMPRAELVELDAGHCPMFERPLGFNAALLAFVRSVSLAD